MYKLLVSSVVSRKQSPPTVLLLCFYKDIVLFSQNGLFFLPSLATSDVSVNGAKRHQAFIVSA